MTPRHVALLMAALAAIAFWQWTLIPEPVMQQAVGPRLFTALVVAALALVAVLYGVSAWRGRQIDLSHEDGQSALPGAQGRLLSVLGGGLAFMLLVVPLGFVIPATLCGMGVARGFDAPLGWRSALINLLVAAAFWTLFAQILGVGLGPALPWGI
ncbi:MAG: hypothetical protein RIQ38_1610 [Pseudomonadota bacterium]